MEPSSFVLGVQEMKNITVWVFPLLIGDYHNSLLCTVVDNPRIVEFPVHCKGCKYVSIYN